MKKQLLIIFFVCSFTALLNAQWELISTPIYSNPYYECGYPSYNGWVASNSTIYWTMCATCTVGGMGQFAEYKIYLSTDSGLNWSYITGSQLGYYGGVIDINFCSPITGYINLMTESGTEIFRTDNSMTTKQKCVKTTNGDFLNAMMIDYNDLYVIDDDAKILHLENDTLKVIYQLPFILYETWTPPPRFAYTTNHDIYLACKSGINGTYANDLILKSEDGGYSWDTSYISNANHINNLKFSTDSLGFAIGENGLILKTIDAGITWQFLSSGGVSNNLLSIDFRNDQRWIIGGGNILYTSDGGENWNLLTTPTGGNIKKIYFPEKDEVLMIQTSSALFKSNIDLLTSVSEQKKSSQGLGITPNPATDQIVVRASVLTRETKLIIFDVNGEKIMERQLTDTETQIDISALPRGVYFVRLQNEKMVEVGKMVKE